MWVRSQNKDFIKKVKSLRISRCYKITGPGEIKWLDSYAINDDEDVELGVYSSILKAKTVLDYIQSYIALGKKLYVLPQDNEV